MIAAVDIGGTKTLVAVFNSAGKIIEQIKFATPKNYTAFKSELANTVAKLSTKQFTSGVVGIRGNVDRDRGLSLYDDVLPWGQVPVRDDVARVFNCKLVLENDSKLAGLSEANLLLYEFTRVLYVTISTGIGSSFVVNGRLDQDTINSEVGKSLYEHDGTLQKWEDFASGRAIVAKYHKRASEIEDPEAWEDIARNIALGLINAIAVFTPEIVVFGGGVGTHFSKFSKPLRKALAEIRPKAISLPVIRVAQRSEEAVIYGCYELAKQNHAKHTK